MRYYDIVISDTGGSVVRRYTSFPNGKNNPGALNVELDIPVFPFASPMGAGYVKVWGIPINDISQASDLNNKNIAIYAGMQKGLPLANPRQAGLIVKGMVFQAFGNWEGTSQSLDMIIQPNTGTPQTPKNLSLNWVKGTTLSTAIKTTLDTAFPDFKTDIRISDRLKLNQDEPGFYHNVIEFAQYIRRVSKSIIKDADYSGVDIILTQDKFVVIDGSSTDNPKNLQFQDMIGQPTWINPLSVQVKCVMRADLNVGDSIKFPPSIATTTQGGNSPLVNAKSIFQGVFQINQIRHIGNFRQPDAASWVTVIDSFSTKAAA